ncbi:hypothetical protein [Rhodopirellula bahusiensis]|uniref:hypothetical protein n=5 Tax=Rhodopirellula bahusiensis TaxID=2014065 RepID=UPI0032986521
MLGDKQNSRPMNVFTTNTCFHAMRVVKVVLLTLSCMIASSLAVADEPTGALAAHQIRSGRLLAGRANLLKAIDLSSHHAANRKAVGLEAAELFVVDREFGKQQFQQLLADRPKMTDNLPHLGPVRDWLISSLGGGLTGFRIEWSSEIPSSPGAEAEHYAPNRRFGASVRIALEKRCSKNGLLRPLTSEELWHHLVFECFNASETEKRSEIDKRAAAGLISREAYIAETFATEHRAVQMTHKFYADVYLPCAAKAGLESDPKVWYVEPSSWWKEPSEVLQLYPKDGYPWTNYGAEYDSLIAHLRRSQQ